MAINTANWVARYAPERANRYIGMTAIRAASSLVVTK